MGSDYLDQLPMIPLFTYGWGRTKTTDSGPRPIMVIMRRHQEVRPRSIITMRNQRGYGTQKNWMAEAGTPLLH